MYVNAYMVKTAASRSLSSFLFCRNVSISPDFISYIQSMNPAAGQFVQYCTLLNALSAVLEQSFNNFLMKWVAPQDEVIWSSVTVWQSCALSLRLCVSFWLDSVLFIFILRVALFLLSGSQCWLYEPIHPASDWSDPGTLFWCWCHETATQCFYMCNIFQSTNFIRGENRSTYQSEWSCLDE